MNPAQFLCPNNNNSILPVIIQSNLNTNASNIRMPYQNLCHSAVVFRDHVK